MVLSCTLMDYGGKFKESKEEKLRRLCRAWSQEVTATCRHRLPLLIRLTIAFSFKFTGNLQEDEEIVRLVELHGSKNWSLIGAQIPGRSGKQCRERYDVFRCMLYYSAVDFGHDLPSARYKNQLDPAIKTGPWTPEEDKAIVCAQVFYISTLHSSIRFYFSVFFLNTFSCSQVSMLAEEFGQSLDRNCEASSWTVWYHTKISKLCTMISFL